MSDVQVVPPATAPASRSSIDAGTLGEVSLFATRGSEIGVTPSVVTSPGDGETAYWTAARTAYALSGGRDHAGLGDAARRLAGQGATKL